MSVGVEASAALLSEWCPMEHVCFTSTIQATWHLPDHCQPREAAPGKWGGLASRIQYHHFRIHKIAERQLSLPASSFPFGFLSGLPQIYLSTQKGAFFFFNSKHFLGLVYRNLLLSAWCGIHVSTNISRTLSNTSELCWAPASCLTLQRVSQPGQTKFLGHFPPPLLLCWT